MDRQHIKAQGGTKAKSVMKEIFSWVRVIGIGVVAGLLLIHFVVFSATVTSGSMIDTLAVDSRIVAFRLSYLFSNPERLDIVAFKFPDDENQLFVKRIIGVPGDTIEFFDGRVYVNGEMLEEAYTIGPSYWDVQQSYIVPPDSYFMMGDNRVVSDDSRSWRNTFVQKDKIIGKVLFSYYPSIKAIK